MLKVLICYFTTTNTFEFIIIIDSGHSLAENEIACVIISKTNTIFCDFEHVFSRALYIFEVPNLSRTADRVKMLIT